MTSQVWMIAITVIYVLAMMAPQLVHRQEDHEG